MRIGFCHVDDPLNRLSWSGTPSFMFQALADQPGLEVVSMGPLPNRFLRLGKAIRRSSLLITGREYHYKYSDFVNQEYARHLYGKITEMKPDILFMPALSTLAAILQTDLPTVYLSDATFRLMTDYHPRYSNLWEVCRRKGETAEAKAIARCSALIFSSSWAAESAIQHYGADSDKTFVIPFGANLPDGEKQQVPTPKRLEPPYKLLFVGVDWVHKGGQIALDTQQELNRRGIPCELCIVGCATPAGMQLKGVTATGFINKNSIEGAIRLRELYAESDFFILPTRNEAAGIVFCEASASGLPIIATNTGGVASYVESERTGYLCSMEDTASTYADKIEFLISNPEVYSRMSGDAREKYEQELNWHTWGRKVRGIMERICTN